MIPRLPTSQSRCGCSCSVCSCSGCSIVSQGIAFGTLNTESLHTAIRELHEQDLLSSYWGMLSSRWIGDVVAISQMECIHAYIRYHTILLRECCGVHRFVRFLAAMRRSSLRACPDLSQASAEQNARRPRHAMQRAVPPRCSNLPLL